MATIIAMGGGARTVKGQLAMRKAIIAETRKKHPKVLYIPPDGGEELDWWPIFERRMIEQGCEVQPLFLLRERNSRKEVDRLIADADLIFVGGGNTLRMMKMWRRFGVDTALLDTAKTKSKVLAGVSAGAICWFEYGHSDSRSFSGKDEWPYIRVRGLGLVPGTFCPHVLGENRLHSFSEMMAKFGGVGYGADDGTALVIKYGAVCVMGDPKRVFRVTREGAERVSAEFRLSCARL